MNRTKVLLVILSVLLVFGLGVGVGLHFAGSAPDVDPGTSGELAEPADGAGTVEVGEPDEPGPPAWTLRAGPTDKGGEKGPTLRAPDQPGWTTRVGPTAYDLTLAELVAAGRISARLGEVVGDGDIRRMEPFVLAALPLGEDDSDMAFLEQVVAQLREQKIVSFATPVLMARPAHPDRPETWEEEREAWAGVPVAPGTELAPPLVAMAFEGGDVVASEVLLPETGEAEDWAPLIATARAAGREPAFPILYRFSGWVPLLKDIHVQWILPLEAPPAAPEAPPAAPEDPVAAP